MPRITLILLIIIVFTQCNNLKIGYNIHQDSNVIQNDTAKDVNENSADTIKVMESKKSIIKIEKNDMVLSSTEKVTSIFLRKDKDISITIIKEKDSTIFKNHLAGRKLRPALKDCDCTDIITMNGNPRCNHKFEFRGVIFSDFVGIKDDQPNGLIQTNFYLSYTRPTNILKRKFSKKNSINKKKSGAQINVESNKIEHNKIKNTGFTLFRNIIILDVTFSNLDIQKRELPVGYNLAANNQYTRHVNKFDLLQYAHVISASKINLVTFRWYKVAWAYLDFIPMYYSTLVSDTLLKKEAFQVSSIAYGLNLKVIIDPHEKSNLSAQCSFSVYWPQIVSHNIQDNAKLQLKEQFYNPARIEYDYYPTSIQAIDLRIIKGGEKGVSTFVRFASYGNFFRRKGVPLNSFVQFQLGAKINIDRIFKSS